MKSQVVEFTEGTLNKSQVYINVPVSENIYIKDISREKEKKKINLYIEKTVKRSIDICGSLIGIVLLIPITLVIYIANKKYGDGGPIFYTQDRIGKDGKMFKIIKYRSMIIGAEIKLKEYLKNNIEAKKEYNKYKKLKNDPRITPIGNFLRRTSLDEFPQFINVLKGDMSLVGPRPYLPEEKDDMGIMYNKIIKRKPGMTGYWQIEGRNNVSFDDRLDMDMKYCNSSSLKLDLKLLLKTVIKVLKREGAM